MNSPRNKSTYTNANLVLEYVLQCGILDVNVSLWVSLFVGSKNYNCVQFWFHYKDFNLVSSLTKLPLQFKWWIERATHRGPAHWCIVLEYRPAGDLLTRGYEIFVWLICFLERNSCFNDDIFTLEPCRSNHFRSENQMSSSNLYYKSLVNANSFYVNFINTHFQKVPIPHLTRTMKQKFLH